MVEFAEVENLEFKWGKKRGLGGKKKDVRFYESFTYDGVEYALYDCVYMYKEGELEPYIGKLIKIWENADKTKRVKVLWFFRPCEISNFLGNERVPENELFLACGEGAGLANVNPLEAISGKCKVVCISKDDRNPQPSAEELQMSDFVFYRTFHVKHCKIFDTIDEMIAGIEVKFIFNRLGSQKSSGDMKLDSEKKHVAVASEEVVISAEQRMHEEHATEETKGKPTSCVDLEPGERGKMKIKEDASLSNTSLDKQRSLLGKKSVSSVHIDCSEAASATNKVEKVVSGVGVQTGKMSRADEARASDKTSTKFEKKETKSGRVSDIEFKEKVNSTKDPSDLDNRPSKKMKLDSSVKIFDDKYKNGAHKLRVDFDGTDAKDTVSATTNEDKSKFKLATAKDSHEIEKDPSKKRKGDAKLLKPTNDNLPKASSMQMVGNERDNQAWEVTRRPNLDRNKWFRELPWEEKMRRAHDQGTLVLLGNLDPSYTSSEVEDIIWHAFKENCSAKMLPRFLFSSPHSGLFWAAFELLALQESSQHSLAILLLINLNSRCNGI
ncbi:protein ANTI-SILENCING 1 isoform X2 [Mangifera indica]|uniref:protein ANTI-SILENCING 1 isoform X2 n=1 Tax=Mangifera indica TaxID=29780 RepID=UPI001CF95C02|nr:protein ANTI-SILENCING 1 isoform X2 [Mangifera indica]